MLSSDCLTCCRTIMILAVCLLSELRDFCSTRNIIKLQHEVQIMQYCSFCHIYLKLNKSLVLVIERTNLLILLQLERNMKYI